MSKTKITLIVEKTNTGFSAYSENYPISTTGNSITELIINAFEATEFYFKEESEDSNPEYQLIIKFEIDSKQF